MIDRAFNNRFAGHFLQAQRLRGELQIIVLFLPAWAVFVFHRVGIAAGIELDQIGLADQTKPLVPHRHGALDAHRALALGAGLIHQGMHSVAARGV